MKDEFSHIFESSEHIDESRLWLYAKGELTPEESHEIEKHLLGCPMCSDVVEGFSLYDSEGSFNASMNRTSEAFFSKSRSNRKILIRRMSIAAVIVLLAGSTFVLVTQLNKTKISEPELAQEIIHPESADKHDAESTVGILHEDTSIASDIAMNTFEKELLEEAPSEREITGNAGALTAPEVEELYVISDDYEEDALEIDMSYYEEPEVEEEIVWNQYADVYTEDSESEDVTLDKDPESVTEAVAEDNTQNEVDELSEVVVVTESTDSGFHLFNRRNRSRSQKSAEMPISAEFDAFSSGMNAYNNEQYSVAVNILSQIERDDESYWDARWIMADSYVKMSNPEKAIEQYRILQDTASPYKYSAGEKLQELGE